MRLQKTDRARSALVQHGPDLSAHDRRLLILSDGKRSLDDIVALLGADVRPRLLHLLDRGYLIGVSHRGDDPANVDTPRAKPDIAATPPAPAPPAPPRAVRRSLAATKMYLLDILQLQRDPDAAALRAVIHTSVGQDALLAAILDAAAHVQRTSNASYGQRVIERVAEIIPEDALAELEARCVRGTGTN